MDLVRKTLALASLALLAGCSSAASPAAHVAPVIAASANHWQPMQASFLTTTGCPSANWTCVAGAAQQAGGAALGPAKGSDLRVVGLVTRHSSTGSLVKDVDYFLARGHGAVPVWVGAEQPRPASFVLHRAEPVTVRGVVGLAYSNDTPTDHEVSIFWNEAGRGFDVLITDDPARPMPTVAEAVAIVSSLVRYPG